MWLSRYIWLYLGNSTDGHKMREEKPKATLLGSQLDIRTAVAAYVER